MGNKQSAAYSTESPESLPAYKGGKSNFRRTGSLPSRLNHAKHNSLIEFENTAKFLYVRAENFPGLKNDDNYKQIQTEVVEASKELQEYRNKLRKSDRLAADDIQRTLSSCLSILVKKAQDNEKTVLDNAAVETNSFIAQNLEVKSDSGVSEVQLRKAPVPAKEETKPKKEPKKEEEKIKDSPKPQKNRRSAYAPGSKYHRRMQPLHEIEREVRDLKSEIDEAILLQNVDKFESQEKRIKSICIQLELIKAESYTPLSEKKSELYETMIKCNKSIKRTRRKLQRQSVVDTPEAASSKRDLDAIEKKINEAEKQLEKEEALSSVKDKMKDLLSKLNNMKDSSTIKDRKVAAAKKIKNILNDIQILDLEQRLSKLQMMVLNFSDTKESSQYIILDQLLRQLWDEVSELDVPVYKKQIIVNNIQEALKLLVKNCKVLEQPKQEIVYENKNVVKLNLQSQAVSPIKINKPPLPSPRDATVSNTDNSQNSLIQQLQLLDDVSNWNSVSEREATIIKNKLATIMSKIDEALDGLPKNSEHHNVQDYEENITPPENTTPEKESEIPKEETVTTGVVKKYGSLDNLESYGNKSNADSLELEQQALKNTESTNTQETVDITTPEQPNHEESNSIHFNFLTENADKLSSPESKSLPTLSQLTDQISSIQKIADDFYLQMQGFTGIYKDNTYDRIHNGLNQCIEELNSIDSFKYTTVETSKLKLLQHILNIIDELSTKVLQNQVAYKATKAELKEIAERLSNTKKKIDNFIGAYKNVLYVQIETELLKCLDKLQTLSFPSDAKLQQAIAQTKQKAEQFLRILEQKSTKSYTTHSPEAVQSNELRPEAVESKTPSEEVQRLRKRLLKVRNDAENFTGTTDDPMYALIQNDLWECSEELKQMQDLGKQSVIDSKKQYLEYVEQLQIYLQQKAEQAAYYSK